MIILLIILDIWRIVKIYGNSISLQLINNDNFIELIFDICLLKKWYISISDWHRCKSLYYTVCISLSYYFSLYILFVHMLVDNWIPLGVHFSLIPYPYRLRQWLISRKPVWRSYSKGKTWPTQAWPLPATALGLGQKLWCWGRNMTLRTMLVIKLWRR